MRVRVSLFLKSYHPGVFGEGCEIFIQRSDILGRKLRKKKGDHEKALLDSGSVSWLSNDCLKCLSILPHERELGSDR